MKQINYKKLILPNIPYVFFVYLFDKVGQAVRLAPGADISAKILNITQGFSAAFESALPSIYPLDLLVGIVGAVIIRLIVYVKGKNAKKYRKGAEYGSARWGNAEDIKPYIDPEFQNNIILTQTERLTMVLAMLPMFLLAMYEKNGQPLEVIIRQFVEVKFLRPKERPYQTNNFYAALARQERLDKEVRAIVKGKGKDPKRKA